MANDKNQMLCVDDVSERLGVSRSYAYRVIRKLNAELKERGMLTIPGKVNSAFLEECYFSTEAHAQPPESDAEGDDGHGGV